MLGVDWLCGGSISGVAIVGYSFGGAVAISADALDGRVTTVVAMSAPQPCPSSRRAHYWLHGDADEILPLSCQEIHRRAREPKRLLVYPGARHGLDECRAQLDADLEAWLMAET